ncbi:winged helix-turn-helix transcriptional regulator [Azospirillum halopraeferens]|uniref:winged helix-turn-helix transcriptional regulator n=1 Tax=Azospirillum halopraeferens TaxID=34010 RepID=UPI00041FA11E|nr:helix-turn-helix domain-containing protein [Azospirillum halopraeferens]
MHRKSFDDMGCPVARSLERVGEWWSILILRDALRGLSRFDEFRESLGIAPNMLSRRLASLVENGLLERRRYSVRPPRYAYVPTAAGRDFLPVIAALFAWGNRHCAPEGPTFLLVDAVTGAPVDPLVVDRHTHTPIAAGTVRLAAASAPIPNDDTPNDDVPAVPGKEQTT